MPPLDTQTPEPWSLTQTIAILETQLVELDRMRLHVGAAHLDAAIQQLRVDQARRMAS